MCDICVVYCVLCVMCGMSRRVFVCRVSRAVFCLLCVVCYSHDGCNVWYVIGRVLWFAYCMFCVVILI